MKINLIYLAAFLALAFTGCTHNDNIVPTATLPAGNFTGQFLRIRLNQTTAKFDTLTANLQLSLSQATGFKITGDTTLHAGSFGVYAADAYYVQFADQTFSASRPFTKYHLEGLYNYAYDGTKLTIYVNYADTLSLQYQFKKLD